MQIPVPPSVPHPNQKAAATEDATAAEPLPASATGFARARYRVILTDAFILLVLLLAGFKYMFALKHIVDVRLYDETNYLISGTSLRQYGLPTAANAPLYALWYHALWLLQPDAVNLYYLNYLLTSILPPLLLYLVLRVSRVPVTVSAIVAVFFLDSVAILVTWPRVSHFSLLITLAFLALSLCVRRVSLGLLLMSLGALLASYVRPESFLAFLLLLVIGAGWLLFERRGALALPRTWVPLGATLLLAAGLLGVFGLPVFGASGSARHFEAFTQHFAINWCWWNHLDINGPYNPWTNAHEIFGRYFGDATTVSAALRRNPAMFAKHLLTNVRTLVVHLPDLFAPAGIVFLPPRERFRKAETWFMLLALAAMIVASRQTWWPRLKRNCRGQVRLLGTVLLVSVPAIISVIEIFPHDHYLLLLGTLFIVVVTALLTGQETSAPNLAPRYVLLLALGILAGVPTLPVPSGIVLPTVKTIRYLQALQVTAPVNLLDADGGFFLYLPSNYHGVHDFEKHQPFNQFRAERAINMIVLEPGILQDSHFANDPEWHTFLDHCQELGFEVRPVPETSSLLLVQHGLLRPGS